MQLFETLAKDIWINMPIVDHINAMYAHMIMQILLGHQLLKALVIPSTV